MFRLVRSRAEKGRSQHTDGYRQSYFSVAMGQALRQSQAEVTWEACIRSGGMLVYVTEFIFQGITTMNVNVRCGARTVLFTALFSGALHAAPSDTISLRVEDMAAVQRLGIQPQYSADYVGFHWLQVNASEYASMQAAGIKSSLAEDANRIRFGEFDFDPLSGQVPDIGSTYSLTAKQSGLRLVQFNAPLRSEWLDSLRKGGIEVLQYYPHNTVLVWGGTGDAQRVETQSEVRWQGPFLNAWKKDVDLLARQGRINNVDVHFYNDGNVEAVLALLRDAGANVLRHAPAQPDKRFFDAWIEIDASALEQVAAIPHVVWFGYASPVPQLEDEMSAQILAGNYNASNVPQTGYVPWLASINYNGNGVTWAVIDTGVDLSHPDLAPNIVGGYSYTGCSTSNGNDYSGGGHGTHVAGIIAGLAIGDGVNAATDANGFRYGQGVAPGAKIYAFSALCGAWPPAGGWQELSRRAVTAGTVGANASWTTGEGTAHGYKASERTFDMMIRDGNFDTPEVDPFIFVFSAGNSGPGPSTLTAPKEAKNPIIVASSRNHRAGSINDISGFSSRGPAVDGRNLPTVAAPGEVIASTRRLAGASSCGTAIAGTGGLYSNCSGTSMAAPSVSGSAAMLIERWRSAHSGDTPSPAMVKALLVNGAIDITSNPIPDNSQGWGRVSLPGSLGLGRSIYTVDQSDLIDATGQIREFVLGVPEPSNPVRVTLAWTDAPGAVNANPALVNDLDLEVIVGANTYLGNVFSSGTSTTGGIADTLNNVENVYLSNPGGALTVRIRGTAIQGDGVPGNTTPLDQDFALICDNCSLQPTYTIAATPTNVTVCAPADADYAISTRSVLGYTDLVTFSVSATPAGSSSSFSSNPVTPGAGSMLTIGNTAAVAPGHHDFVLGASSTSGVQSRNLGLDVATAIAAAPLLSLPSDGETNVAALPTFTWTSHPEAVSYTIEIATDAGFSNIVRSASVTQANYVETVPLDTSTHYFWRVRVVNGCGTSANGPAFSFTTIPAPGDCPASMTTLIDLQNDVEGGAAGWTATTLSGSDNWTISEARSVSPTHSWTAINTGSTSDKVLVSPVIAISSSNLPASLEFQHWRDMESSGSSACYDGGLLEVSVGNGAFVQVPGSQLLTDPYTGAISSSFGNPLAGSMAWCGIKPFTRSVVDLIPYAGQSIRLRFRLATDTSVGREGWYVDDIRVKSCTSSDVIFENGFD